MIFFQSVYYLVYSTVERKVKFLYIAYGTVLFILVTISVVANGYFGQLVWLEHRDFPGGSGSYFLANVSLWLNTFGTAADAAADVLGDALLVCLLSYPMTNTNRKLSSFIGAISSVALVGRLYMPR